ncbi:geranylgeranylglyceryl/heptaprenylglyceryl phosphate synthase [Vulcanibacillus modesticaldus]|uniref:Heptaprenylglyceryl phosphate synthase n=2 Tax=Vulcanibacillus modesticaldus TaxID=337097 RepID=A0A1D2YUX4_9BACI|nr:heptaprenylglyceryl phosphate synthase [Vulcanibacillus modesticaldus]OEF99487.1 geranylgeranylglyceryl/heptaprenylglyceryl phosphate synthase [Vulcanibacillus modesticaldus]
MSSINHIFKLDPNRPISEEQVNRLCLSGTDAIVVGGTLGVTYENTENLLRLIRKNSITTIQEISSLDAIVPGFDYYFIPLVLNAQDPTWILNAHHQALKKYGDLINWEQVLVEGYIVLNGDSSVAKLTKSLTDLSVEDVIAYARMVDQMLKLPILYLEFSGTYAEVELIEELKYAVDNTKIFYGGGIDSIDKAKEMSSYVDTVVVGNVIYENFELALETVNIQKNNVNHA